MSDDVRRFSAILRTGSLASDTNKSFDRLTETVRDQVSVPMSVVSLVTRDEQVFMSRSGVNLCSIARDLAFCDHTIRTPKPMVVEDACADPRFQMNDLVAGPPYIRSYLGAPIAGPGGVIVGSLCAIDTKPRKFSDKHISLVQSLARVAEETITLHHRSLTDTLTGLINRRGMGTAAEYLFAEHARHGCGHGLILMDLDHFKSVNDRFGHEVGDVVLGCVAGKMCEVLDETAIIGRIGGEEFAVLLPDSDEASAAGWAEELRAALFSADTAHIAPNLSISASFGVAGLDGRVESCSDWLAGADAALYRAKDGGRNRVCLLDR